MLLIDVNVLVNAFRDDSSDHSAFRTWLDKALGGDEPVGLADVVLSGFLRIVTHPRVFRLPTPLQRALDFLQAVRAGPAAVRVTPGERHWETFINLCRAAGARGNLVPDAFLAALAIESGGEWITADRAYARFPGLRWRHPLDPR